jgi:amino acid permease
LLQGSFKFSEKVEIIYAVFTFFAVLESYKSVLLLAAEGLADLVAKDKINPANANSSLVID